MSIAFPFRTAFLLCAVAACGGSEGDAGGSSGSSDTQLGGTSTWKGKTADCKTETQDFAASGQFSVLCQTESDSQGKGTVVVQFTFKDEASARTAGSFTVLGGTAFSPDEHPDPRTAQANVIDDEHAYGGKDSSTGTMTVTTSGSKNVLTITDVQVYVPGEDAPSTVSATIDF